MKFREVKKTDIKDILNIRVSTKENHFSMDDLAEVISMLTFSTNSFAGDL